MKCNNTISKEIERSIIKTYRKDIWSKFIKAINEFALIKDNDKIMVCISGGKDSFLLAKCIQELQRHGKIKFDACYVTMDPGYKKEDLNKIIANAKLLNIPLQIFTSDIFKVVKKISRKSPCYLCAKMRRGYLYDEAKKRGCNKIALGHHLNDVIETTLLSMFYSGELKTMMPKLHSDNFQGLELIRPLYFVKEASIISFQNYHHLEFSACACPISLDCSLKKDSKRLEIKNLIKELKKTNKDIEYNIYKALDNVNLNCVLKTKDNNKTTSFLENYDK